MSKKKKEQIKNKVILYWALRGWSWAYIFNPKTNNNVAHETYCSGCRFNAGGDECKIPVQVPKAWIGKNGQIMFLSVEQLLGSPLSEPGCKKHYRCAEFAFDYDLGNPPYSRFWQRLTPLALRLARFLGRI